jgi:hypothetical protein
MSSIWLLVFGSLAIITVLDGFRPIGFASLPFGRFALIDTKFL